MPDAAARKAIDDLHTELGRCACCILHFLGSTLTDAFGLAVAPDARRQDALVPLVDDGITDALTDQVGADRKTLKAVLFQNIAAAADIAVAFQGLVYLEVIAPAGQFQAVVAPAFHFFRPRVQRQVGPLPGEKSHRSCHRKSLLKGNSQNDQKRLERSFYPFGLRNAT